MELIKFEAGQVWIDSNGNEQEVIKVDVVRGTPTFGHMDSGVIYSSANVGSIDTLLIRAILVGLKSDLAKEPELEYPIFKKNIVSGRVYKFTQLTCTELVQKESEDEPPKEFFNVEPHTNKDIWQDIHYNEERGLADKEVIIVKSLVTGAIAFAVYDAKNDCLFDDDGTRNGFDFGDTYTVEEAQEELLERVNAND